MSVFGRLRVTALLGIRAQILPLEIAQFVLSGEIRGGVPGAALKADDFHAGLAELGGKNRTGRSDADNDDVGFSSCHTRRSSARSMQSILDQALRVYQQPA